MLTYFRNDSFSLELRGLHVTEESSSSTSFYQLLILLTHVSLYVRLGLIEYILHISEYAIADLSNTYYLHTNVRFIVSAFTNLHRAYQQSNQTPLSQVSK